MISSLQYFPQHPQFVASPSLLPSAQISLNRTQLLHILLNPLSQPEPLHQTLNNKKIEYAKRNFSTCPVLSFWRLALHIPHCVSLEKKHALNCIC